MVWFTRPALYNSVYMPAKIDPDIFNIISTAIDNLNYDTYLKSMVAKYIFLLPTNDGLLTYIDPVSYGLSKTKMWQFKFDAAQENEAKRIYAEVYDCEMDEDGHWQKTGDSFTTYRSDVTSTNISSPMVNRIQRMLDEIIAIEGYQPGKKYYRTKGNTFVHVEGVSVGDEVYGSLQETSNEALKATHTYEYRNGHTLVVDGIVQGTSMSVAQTLSAHPEFSEFLTLLQVSGALSKDNDLTGYKWLAGDQTMGNVFNVKNGGTHGAENIPAKSKKATFLFNNYHYTLYVPTNEAMELAYSQGLPTPADLEEAQLRDVENGYDATKDTLNEAGRITEAMLDFIKYHLHDNSIYVDAGFNAGDYETAKVKYEPAYDSDEEGNVFPTGKYAVGRPYTLNVTPSATGITVVDGMGTSHQVDVSSGLYNITAREYWIKGDGNKVPAQTASPTGLTLNNSSSIVIHAINEPLLYDAPAQFHYVYKPTE